MSQFTSKKYGMLKLACYMANISMSVVGNLSPILFITFRHQFGLSYSLLGLLVLINFCTQLGIDLIFSFFSHKFHIPTTVRLMPILTAVGLGVYAIVPMIFPDYAYLGLAVGTFLFAISGGLGEVLISPIIATIPAENPDREMSKLHSIYAWGVVGFVIFATLFLWLFGEGSWFILTLILTVIPLLCACLFFRAQIPEMSSPEKVSGVFHYLKNKGIWLCFFAMFLAGSSECTMAQWSSGYLEQSFGIPKVWGDMFGVALFAMFLGLGRSLFAKYGNNVCRVLFFGAIGATACYFIAAISPFPVVGLLACAFTGFCTSMLWPGSLVVASDRYPDGGVLIFAMMAAGGDMGASVGPQLIGLITDATLTSPAALSLAETLHITPEQLGMKFGMLIGMLFPLLAILIYGIIQKQNNKLRSNQ